MRRPKAYPLSVACLALCLAACSGGPTAMKVPASYPEPVFSAARLLPPDYEDMTEVYDPWRGLNLRIYNFNYHFDQAIFLPVANAYNRFLPRFVRRGINNFFGNFGDMRTMLNSALQLSPEKFFNSSGRVFANSTLGLAGFIDVASTMGIPRPDEDLGQTLGYWGVGQGPYVVIPFLGPSNLRDGLGMIPDLYVQTYLRDQVVTNDLIQGPAFLLQSIDIRATTPFRYYENGSAYEYRMVRWLWSTKRELDIAK